jgi:guanylate kinase
MDGARPPARLTVVSAPSGVGLDRVIELVRARAPFPRVPVPVTTRRRRAHEIDGVQYVFVDVAGFDRLVAGGALLEWAAIGGNRYGTPRAPVAAWLAAGDPVLLAIDPRGAALVRAQMPDAQLVWIAPPGTPAPAGFDTAIPYESGERTADELVSLLGSPFLTPARPPSRG